MQGPASFLNDKSALKNWFGTYRMKRRQRLQIAFGVMMGGLTAGLLIAGPRLFSARPLIAAFLSGATAMVAIVLPAATRKRACLVLTSLLVTWYVLQVVVAILPPAYVVVGRRLGRTVDRRTRLEVVRDLRLQGIDAYPANVWLPPAHHLPDPRTSVLNVHGAPLLPLSSISRKLSVLCNETGAYVSFQSDEHGFNNPSGLWASGAPDLVVLGDSFIEGSCVPTEDTVASDLRRNGQNVLSLGIAGSGPLVQLAVLSEYARFLRPRTIVWVFYEGNDLEDLRAERQVPLLLEYLERSDAVQQLIQRQDELDRVLEEVAMGYLLKSTKDEIKGLVYRCAEFAVLLPLQQWLGRCFHPPVARPEPQDLELLSNILRRAESIADQWNGRMLFVYLPHFGRYTGYIPAAVADQTRNAVFKVVRAAGIPILDLARELYARRDLMSLTYDSSAHLNERGYRVVAGSILARLAALSERVHASKSAAAQP
jgi:hypothetical protein